MSSCVRKTTPRTAAPHLKTVNRDLLLEAMLNSAVSVKRPCSYCEDHRLSCKASSDSSRCFECVSHNQSLCDAKGVSAQHLRKIALNFRQLEAEMEEAEDELAMASAKVKRLRQQKRKWSEKMIRAVSRGVDSVEELEELERKEAEEASALERAAVPAAASSSSPARALVAPSSSGPQSFPPLATSLPDGPLDPSFE